MNVLRFAPLALLSLVACGARSGDEETDKTGATSPSGKATTKSEFFSVFVAKLCAAAEECSNPILSYGGHCVEVFESALQSGSIVAHPEVHFDANAGATCLQALDDLGCSTDDLARAVVQSDALGEACALVFYGDGDVNDPCSINEQCKVGLQCDTSASCPGSCQPTPKLGEPCVASGPECADHLECFGSVCTPPGQAGDACGSDYPDCSRVTSCDYLSPMPTCIEYTVAEPGAPCTAACKLGYTCAAPAAGEAKVCRPVGKLGGACIGYNDCEAGAHCSEVLEAGVCEKDVDLGEVCDPEELIPCRVGRCLSGVCAFPNPLGEPCQTADECASSTCVEGICELAPDCPVDPAQ